MSVTDELVRHLQAGRPLTAMSARQTYGITDIRRALWNVRILGHHVTERRVTTVSKYTGRPVTTVEYRMDDEDSQLVPTE